MLRLLRFRALDLARWAACVAASPGAPPYVQAWWLAATARRWAAVVELGPAGEYRSLLPLPTKWRPGGRVAYQPLFTQQLGLVLTPESQQRDLAAYLAVAARHCARFYQQLPPAAAPLPPLPPGFTAAERLTYHLDLSPGAEALRAGYAPDYRRRLRRNAGLATPLRVTPGPDLHELISLFLAYRGPEHTGLHPRHYAVLPRLVAAAQGLAELRQVRHPATGELLAGALFVRHAGGLIYLFAAASAAGRAAGAPLLLLDEAIARHAGQPGQVFDFEGGSLPAIGRFFANFGARPVSYPVLTFTSSPWFPAWMRP
ncbi:GNAT family N-acetyltransferase [Hymenobacter cheonanensis]|uniref:GNAT family N-acetyltransferase n=1 Tax=Hymenobacter sp. CA2-7 TaxID=3063993 RepID=UPI00271432B0|nr:GNAT family N-acetyltransferase [Hymenobacter sp. CA2-7]MDO7887554.1 GNAT family N-acetyltransferase [Hymenobacter sp. CA2-7]